MITFVTFHVDLNKQAEKNILETYGLYQKPSNYISMLDTMFRSAALFHPDCRKVILTDRKTDFSHLKSEVELFRVDIDLSCVMPSRLRAQIQYLAQYDCASDLIFLDSDMIVNGNLEGVFDEDFSVGLTSLDKDNMPINAGLIMVKRQCREAALAFFGRVDVFCREKYHDDTWWGDQAALVDAVGVERFRQRTTDTIYTELDDVKVLFFPCDTYNFAPHPPDKIASISSGLRDRKVIHFRGDRKRFMQPFWSAYLAPKESSRMDRIIKSYYTRLTFRLQSFLEDFREKRKATVLKKV